MGSFCRNHKICGGHSSISKRGEKSCGAKCSCNLPLLQFFIQGLQPSARLLIPYMTLVFEQETDNAVRNFKHPRCVKLKLLRMVHWRLMHEKHTYMGNCICLDKRPMKSVVGLILDEYRSPVKVHDKLLTKRAGHAISKKKPIIQPLCPNGDTHSVVATGVEFSSRVMRIKLVIRKQELEALLRKGVTLNDMIAEIQKKQRPSKMEHNNVVNDGHENSERWKPMLQSITEVN